MKGYSLFLVLPTLWLLGCGSGGGGGLVVGSIHGPSAVTEKTSAQYTVTATGDTGITYQWAVNPPSAGVFQNQTSNTATLVAAEVSADLPAVIHVSVQSDNYGPVVKKKPITVTDVHFGDSGSLSVWEIEGPSEVFVYEQPSYSISAVGPEQITYSWSSDAPSDVVFGTPHLSSTELTFVDPTPPEDIVIQVEVGCSDCETVTRSMTIETLGADFAQSYLGNGHPIEGITYHRNNRSKHFLPGSLSGYDSVIVPYGDLGSFADLVVDGAERLYVAEYWHENIWPYASFRDGYNLFSFCFGDEPVGPYAGGASLAAVTGGVYTAQADRHNQEPYGHGQYYWTRHFVFGFYRYGEWPSVTVSVSDSYGTVAVSPDYGNWDAPSYGNILPLPDGRVLVGYVRNWYDGPQNVFVLDEWLNIEHELVLDSPIRGFAFDEYNGRIYINTAAGLHSYDWSFNEKWNTLGSWADFSTDMPILTDDLGILGWDSGAVKRVEYGGASGPTYQMQVCARPAIFQDGVIAVLGESSIVYLDLQLNLLDEVPLPTGPGTGDQYLRPPLVDKNDNMALITLHDVYIEERDGDILDHRTFTPEIRNIRLGPGNLYVATDDEIYAF